MEWVSVGTCDADEGKESGVMEGGQKEIRKGGRDVCTVWEGLLES